MKKIIFIIYLFSSIISNAQLFSGGLDVGFSASQIDGDLHGGYKKFGISSFVFAQLNFLNKLSFVSGVGFIQKGAREDSRFQFYKTRLNYAEIPLLLNIRFFENSIFKQFRKIDFTFGITYGYLVNASQTIDYTTFSEEEMNLRKYDLSYYSSVNYNFNKKFSLHFVHNYSLIPITKDKFWESLSTNWFFFFLVDPSISKCWWNNVARVTLQYNMFSNTQKQ